MEEEMMEEGTMVTKRICVKMTELFREWSVRHCQVLLSSFVLRCCAILPDLRSEGLNSASRAVARQIDHLEASPAQPWPELLVCVSFPSRCGGIGISL